MKKELPPVGSMAVFNCNPAWRNDRGIPQDGQVVKVVAHEVSPSTGTAVAVVFWQNAGGSNLSCVLVAEAFEQVKTRREKMVELVAKEIKSCRIASFNDESAAFAIVDALDLEFGLDLKEGE